MDFPTGKPAREPLSLRISLIDRPDDLPNLNN